MGDSLVMRIIQILAGVIIFGSALGSTAQVVPSLNTTLEFSVDGGKTYETDFPILHEPCKLLVRLKWNVSGETREVRNGIVTTSLYNENTDFASANRGFHGKSHGWRPDAYYQRLRTYWAKYHHGSFVYKLDLRARPEGAQGVGNIWDGKKFVSGELPPCAALPPGTHKFTVSVGYYLTKGGERVYSIEDFFVSIEASDGSGKGKVEE